MNQGPTGGLCAFVQEVCLVRYKLILALRARPGRRLGTGAPSG